MNINLSVRKSPSKRERKTREESPDSPPRSPRKGGEYDEDRNTSTQETHSGSNVSADPPQETKSEASVTAPQKESSSPAGEASTTSVAGAGCQPSGARDVGATEPQEESRVTPPTETSTSAPRAVVGALPIRSAEEGTPVTSSAEARQTTARLRRHSHTGIIPKHVPAHFDETIGPLPSHVEMRGKKELPTREKPGGSRVGVGSLPGRRDEAGVARLPDERNDTPGM